MQSNINFNSVNFYDFLELHYSTKLKNNTIIEIFTIFRSCSQGVV